MQRITGYELVRQLSLSVETVRHIWLPPRLTAISLLAFKTTVRQKWFSAETIRVILLPAETFGRKQNNADSLGRKLFIIVKALGYVFL